MRTNGYAVVSPREQKIIAVFQHRSDAAAFTSGLPFLAGVFPCNFGVEFLPVTRKRINELMGTKRRRK